MDELRKATPVSSNTLARSDSVPRYRPPRSAPEIIPSTQQHDEVFEEDSIASSRFTRKKLLAQWKLAMVKTRSECSEEEAFAEFAEYAQEDLAKAKQ